MNLGIDWIDVAWKTASVVAVAICGIGIYWAHHSSDEARAECARRGGVLVRTSEPLIWRGFECVQRQP